jgi:hypothetical protein
MRVPLWLDMALALFDPYPAAAAWVSVYLFIGKVFP